MPCRFNYIRSYREYRYADYLFLFLHFNIFKYTFSYLLHLEILIRTLGHQSMSYVGYIDSLISRSLDLLCDSFDLLDAGIRQFKTEPRMLELEGNNLLEPRAPGYSISCQWCFDWNLDLKGLFNTVCSELSLSSFLLTQTHLCASSPSTSWRNNSSLCSNFLL